MAIKLFISDMDDSLLRDDQTIGPRTEAALRVLRARLYDLELQKKQQSEAAERRSQIGSGDRSEKIRTYNFPQGRVTDHRINLSLYRIDSIMDGDLTELIDSLIASDQAQKLSQQAEQ